MGGKGSGNPNLSGKSGPMTPEQVAQRQATKAGKALLRTELIRHATDPDPEFPHRTIADVTAEKLWLDARGKGKNPPNRKSAMFIGDFTEGRLPQEIKVSGLAERSREELEFMIKFGHWPEESKTVQ